MPEFKTLRGMRDLLSEDAERILYVEDVARKVARLYGYEHVITPVVEAYELLAAKAGNEVRSRMFRFKDLGGREVALRPEFTASVARLVATVLRNEPKPFRLFCMGSAYRYDEPQRGRYREFWQSDYELIGSNRPEADAEIIIATLSLMKGVGLSECAIKVGHVGILRGILEQEKVDEKQQSMIMQLMDKKEYDEAFKIVKQSGGSKQSQELLTQLVECKGSDISEVIRSIKGIVKNYGKSVASTENLEEILELVSRNSCGIRLTIDAGFARGLEYYTGMVFEAYVRGMNTALGGGGRYDKLVELFGGEPTPAIGVAHGIDRIALAMQMQKISVSVNRKTVLVVPIKKELRIDALQIAHRLRDAGIVVELEVMGRKMSRVLEDADRRKIEYAVIIGERELKEDAVVIRNLTNREQRTVKIERILNEIKD